MLNSYFAGTALDWAALLLCASAGFAVCRRAGLFNIGLEGQIYAGGFSASFVMLALYTRFPNLPFCVLLLGFLSAAASGAALGALCGFLKKRCGADELITSFLLSAALTPVIDFLIGGPLRGADGNLLAMRELPEALVLRRLLPVSNLNVSVFMCAALLVGCVFFLERTAGGYRLKLAGQAENFARFGGISASGGWIGAAAFSGACAAAAGFFTVAGTDGICYQGFPSGLGWAAITTGLIAGSKPLMLLPAALFYAALRFSADSLLLSTGASLQVFTTLTGLILLFCTVKSGRN